MKERTYKLGSYIKISDLNDIYILTCWGEDWSLVNVLRGSTWSGIKTYSGEPGKIALRDMQELVGIDYQFRVIARNFEELGQ